MNQLHRLGAGTLLLASEHTEKLMREAARKHISEAAADAHHRKEMKRAAMLLLLLATGKRMADSLAAAIVTGRSEARQDSSKRIAAELKEAGIEPEKTLRPMLVVGAMNRRAEDEASARVAGESLATQWRGLARRALHTGGLDGEHPYRSLARSEDLLAPRIKRTAVSETAHAYNDEHREAVRDLDRAGIISGDDVVREWSAMVDACEKCWPLHGSHAGLHDSFPGGAEPGDMHPHCQCVEILVPKASSERLAA